MSSSEHRQCTAHWRIEKEAECLLEIAIVVGGYVLFIYGMHALLPLERLDATSYR